MFKKGTTLVEILMTCTIIGIMASITIVSLSSRRTEKQLEAAANEVVAAIREAQNNALTGKNVTEDCNKSSYIFEYKVSGGVYTVGSAGAGCSYSQYALEDDIRFKNSGSISFGVPFSGMPSDSIRLEKGSDYYYVCVQSGAIYAQKTEC